MQLLHGLGLTYAIFAYIVRVVIKHLTKVKKIMIYNLLFILFVFAFLIMGVYLAFDNYIYIQNRNEEYLKAKKKRTKK